MITKLTINNFKGLENGEYYLGQDTIITGKNGSGKAQPLWAKVLTKKGFVEMGTLKVGDKIISGLTGKEQRVNHIYPQGIKDIYEVTFSKGQKAYCCKEHIWRVIDMNRKENGIRGVQKDITLEEIMNTGTHLNERQITCRRYKIPKCKNLDIDINKELKINPYVLGVLIGDGNLKKGIELSNGEKDIIDKIGSLISDEHNLKINYRNNHYHCFISGKKRIKFGGSLIRQAIVGYGLNVNSYDKFIPYEYIHSSVHNRIELLKGLMDTDGSVYKRGSGIEYTTTSEELKDNICFILNSLGFNFTTHSKQGRYKKDGKYVNVRIAYIINITGDINRIVSSNKHLSKIDLTKIRYNDTFITDIQLYSKEEAQCINVEDSLYITNDFIVTHNSRIIEAIIYCLTGEVNGYKKKLDCSITLQGNGISVSRHKGRITGLGNMPKDTKKLLCGIVPGYINSLTIKDKIKVMTGISEDGSLPFYTGGISSYNDLKLKKAKIKTQGKILEERSEEIIDNMELIREIGEQKIGSLVKVKEEYDKIMQHKEAMAENEGIQRTVDSIAKRKAKLEARLEGFDFSRDLTAVRMDLENRIKKYEELKERIEKEVEISNKLQEGKCSQCGQDYISEQAAELQTALVVKLKKELKDTKILMLRKELVLVKKAAEDYEEKLAYKRELDGLTEPTFIPVEDLEYTEEHFEDLKIKLENFEELYSKQEQKKLLEIKNKSLETKIKEANILNIKDQINEFNRNERAHLLQREKEFKFDFDFKLYKENTTTDGGQFVYEISKDGIDYFWLSSGQKLLIDIAISNHILKNLNMKLLLIDNGERLCNSNWKKAFELCGDKQIVITKVSQGKLNVEID